MATQYDLANWYLDHEHQTIEFELSFFGLDQIDKLTRPPKNGGLTRPFAYNEAELPHRIALSFNVGRLRCLGHTGKTERNDSEKEGNSVHGMHRHRFGGIGSQSSVRAGIPTVKS